MVQTTRGVYTALDNNLPLFYGSLSVSYSKQTNKKLMEYE
jgi:hypothetical protein